MVRFLSPLCGSRPLRRGALPPEALLVCSLIASPAAAGDATLASPLAPLTVVARPGDTLSGLAARHLGDEAAWPRVWAQNAQMRDPNVLEVGDVVHLPVAADAEVRLAHQLDVPGSPAPVAVPSAPLAIPPKAVAPTRPTLGHALWSARRVQAAARIQASSGQGTLLRQGDRLEIDAGDGPAFVRGERYVTLALRNLAHGGGHELFGGAQVVAVTGVACALGDGAHTEARLEHLLAEVEVGQRMAALTDFLVPTAAPEAAPERFRGTLLGLQQDALTLGGSKVVFVDGGKRAGRAPGMRLWLVDGPEAARGPHAKASRPVVPMPPWGELQVVAVEDDSATCLIVRSGREIERGQAVVGGVPTAPEPLAPR